MDINTIPAGREQDELVAEKVMGISKLEFDAYWGPEHRYSTDIAAAWKVVAKIGTGLVLHWVPDQKGLECYGGTGSWVAGHHGIFARAETASLAICRWALIAAAHGSIER